VEDAHFLSVGFVSLRLGWLLTRGEEYKKGNEPHAHGADQRNHACREGLPPPRLLGVSSFKVTQIGDKTAMNNRAMMTCKVCGKPFVTFLEDMAQKNLNVVCPNCRKAHQDDSTMVREARGGAD
jgi:DNA-directed RNA polymerase subunit RPC12/RpoP